VENNIRAARKARFARWPAADVGGGDTVDECGGCQGIAGLEGGPAGGICLKEVGLGVGGVHFCVCGDEVVFCLSGGKLLEE
jgi:hypothetical protein